MTRARLFVVLSILIPWTWFVGWAVMWGEMFALGDAANFFHPLFAWECREWSAGRIPLWNPLDNSGTPVLADASSSVLYPGKFVFALPLDFTRRFNLYVGLHLLLAAFTSYSFARRLRASVAGAGLCAVSFAFGGSVLSQHHNVIFLVGAAWLPLALQAADCALRSRSIRWALVLGVVLALMVLGGDPQLAYHVVLLGMLYALLLARAEKRRRSRKARLSAHGPAPAPPCSSNGWKGLVRSRVALLLVSALSAGLLAAVQVLPAAEWTRASERAAYRAPRSVWEAIRYGCDVFSGRQGEPPSADPRTVARDGLLGRPLAETHHEHIYRYSVGPWRLAELLWPNCTGRMFPTHRRWIDLLPGEGLAWTPSLYVGLLPLWLALLGWRVRGATPRVQWLSWVTLLAVVGSFGWYGGGWLLQELRAGCLGARPDDALIGQPVGGLYWLLVTFLPGYVYFRYPAKWFVVASLGLSLLAARGWDGAVLNRAPRWGRALGWFSGASLSGAAVVWLFRPALARFFQQAPADPLFGPLDASGAVNELAGGLLQSGMLGLGFALVLRPTNARRRPALGAILVAVTALDLMIAHWGIAPTVSGRLVERQPAALQPVRARGPETAAGIPFRVVRVSPWNWHPAEWQLRGSPDRMADLVRWEHDTLSPRYHLSWNVALIESFSTLSSQDYRTLLRVCRKHANRGRATEAGLPPSLLNAVSARFLIGPAPSGEQPTARGGTSGSRGGAEVDVRENPAAFPRAWIVHDVTTMPVLAARDPAAVERRTAEVFFPGDGPRDLRRTAVVEGDLGGLSTDPSEFHGAESCRIVVDEPQRVRIEVRLARPGLLVLNDLYFPGWVCEMSEPTVGTARRLPILRVNRVMRGVVLPAGQQHVTFRYAPWSFQRGAALSLAAWLAMAVLGFVRGWKILRRRTAARS